MSDEVSTQASATGSNSQQESADRRISLAQLRETEPFGDQVQIARNARSLLPDLHLTVASVIQGITIAIIGEEIYRFVVGLRTPYDALTSYTFGVFALASFLMSLLFWTRFVHGGILTYRTFTYATNALFFALAIAQILTFRSTGQPGMWSLWAAITAFLASALHRYTSHRLDRAVPKDEFSVANIRAQKTLSDQMIIIGFVALGGWAVIARFAAVSSLVPALLGTSYVATLLIIIYGSYKKTLVDPFTRWVYHDDIGALEELVK